MSRARGTRALIRLAAGVRLDGGTEKKGGIVLVCPNGNVQLNRMAETILRLCDGSRAREEVVAVVRRSHPHTRAVEIIEFLDAAHARGWIDET
ncbi:MAG TPA: pyrroloquinoline quinone biosynthesis peptide chaperone PqqD [Steroidobacteraceae bacterium]|jgi:coenzyme PQQ biosynthesis protein PqqD|nr:pyrroloquinoline quinone biosynthesis peptide chaperone PqqD [Steroidobacteraceae bacterium]